MGTVRVGGPGRYGCTAEIYGGTAAADGATVPLKRLIAVSDAQYPAGMPPGEYEVCGAHARLEPNGLLWNPARNCLVGATTPMAKMMRLLSERVGLSQDELRTIGRENALNLLGGGVSAR